MLALRYTRSFKLTAREFPGELPNSMASLPPVGPKPGRGGADLTRYFVDMFVDVAIKAIPVIDEIER